MIRAPATQHSTTNNTSSPNRVQGQTVLDLVTFLHMTSPVDVELCVIGIESDLTSLLRWAEKEKRNSSDIFKIRRSFNL